METRGYLRVIADRWLVIAAAALVGLLGAAAYTKASPKIYTAQAKLFVAPASAEAAAAKSPNSVYSASQFVLQRIPSYTQLAGSGQVLQPVIRSLGLNETVSQLASHVTVTNPTASVILDVAAKGRKPRMTAAIANGVADQLAKTIETLERANSAAPSPVVVTVTQHASVPTVPSSPKRTLNLAFGLILGLAIGVGIAVVLAQLDDTIKDARDIREIAGSPPLAMTRAGRRTGRTPSTVTPIQTASSIDSLRVGLAISNGDELPRIVAVTAPVSHDGKATLAASLAVTIARSGSEVCLVEADARDAGLDQSLPPALAGRALCDVLVGNSSVDDALHEWPETGVSVISAGDSSDNAAASRGTPRIEQLLRELAGRFDVVVVDTPPVLPVTDALAIPRIADATVVVVRYSKTKKESLSECFNVLQLAGAAQPSTVMVEMSNRAWRKYSRHVADARQRLRDQLSAGTAQAAQATAARALAPAEPATPASGEESEPPVPASAGAVDEPASSGAEDAVAEQLHKPGKERGADVWKLRQRTNPQGRQTEARAAAAPR